MKIRQAEKKDLPDLIEIEKICFPPEEAADADAVTKRFLTFGENFFVAEEADRVVGFINGAATEQPLLLDELYHDVSLHQVKGAYQTVFGLDVLPEYRKCGIGEKLLLHFIRTALKRGKKGVILTCKDHLVHFYEKAGFRCMGVSASTHGGAKWNDMLLLFSEKELQTR